MINAKLNNTFSFFRKILSSKNFFYFLIALAMAQGLWFALSNQPGLFDEKYHFDFINMYTDEPDPFLSYQPPEWDSLGEIVRDPSYLFYFLMSLPLRIVQLFTDSHYVQVQSLRGILLAVFITGLFFYRKLLIRITGSPAISHTSIFLFLLMPVYATFTAVINYDLVIFAVTPIFFLLFIDLINKKKYDSKHIAWLFFTGGMACLIKFSFLPIFVTTFVLLVYIYWRKGVNFIKKIFDDFKKQKILIKILVTSLIIIPSLLLLERPVYNQIVYGKVTAPCRKVLSEERCSKNYTAARSIAFQQAKPDNFTPSHPLEYFFTTWVVGMTRTQTKVLPGAKTFPLLETLFYIFNIAAISLILINLKNLIRNKTIKYLIITSTVYVLALFIENYMSYTKLGQPVAISFRYIMPVSLILIALAAISFRDVLMKYSSAAFIILVISFSILFTQGGGITSHVLTGDGYYWAGNGTIRKVNNKLEAVANKTIIDRNLLK